MPALVSAAKDAYFQGLLERIVLPDSELDLAVELDRDHLEATDPIVQRYNSLATAIAHIEAHEPPDMSAMTGLPKANVSSRLPTLWS